MEEEPTKQVAIDLEESLLVDLHRSTVRYSKNVSLVCAA